MGVEIMMYQSKYPCFSGRRYGGGQALHGFRKRLMLDVPEYMVEKKVKALIKRSLGYTSVRFLSIQNEWLCYLILRKNGHLRCKLAEMLRVNCLLRSWYVNVYVYFMLFESD